MIHIDLESFANFSAAVESMGATLAGVHGSIKVSIAREQARSSNVAR